MHVKKKALKEKLTGGLLKDMFASADRQEFTRAFLEDYFKDTAFNRKHIPLPTDNQLQVGLKAVLESIADEQVQPASI